MTEKEAYLAYSVDQDASENLMEPTKDGVHTNPGLSERSARYDANLRAFNQAGDLIDYYDIARRSSAMTLWIGQPGPEPAAWEGGMTRSDRARMAAEIHRGG